MRALGPPLDGDGPLVERAASASRPVTRRSCGASTGPSRRASTALVAGGNGAASHVRDADESRPRGRRRRTVGPGGDAIHRRRGPDDAQRRLGLDELHLRRLVPAPGPCWRSSAPRTRRPSRRASACATSSGPFAPVAGRAKLLLVAAAVAARPRLLVLDEVTQASASASEAASWRWPAPRGPRHARLRDDHTSEHLRMGRTSATSSRTTRRSTAARAGWTLPKGVCLGQNVAAGPRSRPGYTWTGAAAGRAPGPTGLLAASLEPSPP